MSTGEKRILIVDDDELVAKVISELVVSIGFKPTVAVNGLDALGIFGAQYFPIVLTDISMPVMNGEELIDGLKGMDEEPVIMVMTGHDEPSIIIDVMRRGVYDYILKPLRLEDLAVKLDRAYEASSLRRMHRSIDKERTVRLEKDLDWYKWNERMMNRDTANVNKSLFHSLHMSFNQGAGFGALLTLLDMIAMNAKEEGGRYILDGDMMRLINENATVARKILKTFADIDWMLSHDLTLQTVSYDELYDMLKGANEELGKSLAIKSQRLHLSEHKPGFSNRIMQMDSEYMRKAFSELVLNACKFSEREYPIYVLIEVIEKNMVVSVVSKPVPDEQKRVGIPLGYENIVFEPFYRMTKAVYEGYESLDYGLGLTLVEKIMSKHGGKASISNIMDYSDLAHEPVTKVIASLSMPLS
jgi:CheY-like chemotaxis protein